MTSNQESRYDPQDLRDALTKIGLTLGQKIGEGGSAAVYSALDRKHDRTVAVKVMRRNDDKGAAGNRFEREIAVVANLQHPHILALFDSGVTPAGSRFYVMPLVKGPSLRKRIGSSPMTVRETIKIGSEVADALEFAHQAGIVHRDIKPENILLDAGHALVADFGIALGVPRFVATGEGEAQAAADTLQRQLVALVDSLYPGPVEHDTRPKG